MVLPTAQLGSFVLSLLTYTHEDRSVVISDVVGDYLLKDMENYVLVKLSRGVVDIMCKVNSRYKPYTELVNGKKYYV